MSEREEDLRLERELREILRGRDPGPAPYVLRGRVDRVPEEGQAPSRRSMARVAGSLVGLAAVLAISVGIVSIGRLLRPDAAGLSGAPATPGSLMPILDGSTGLVAHPPIQGLALAFSVLAGGLLALALGLFVLRRPRLGALALLAGLVVPGAIAALAVMPGVTGDERFGSHTEPISPVEMPPGFTGERLLYLAAGPGEAFETSFALVNDAPLPVTVHGIETVSGGPTDPEWIAVRLVRDASTEPAVITHVDGEPFSPFRLGAGEAMQVRLVGTPGACAVGAAFDPAEADALDYRPVPIRVVYDIAGWPRADTVTLSYNLLVPVSWACLSSAAVSP
ncbi:MAG TPA: hypothetical protein VES19_05755 [Candidatus Limnocylindrales bacterium]|nr:hypothetical protein [Candidatus Limnocylindrales bacterium]